MERSPELKASNFRMFEGSSIDVTLKRVLVGKQRKEETRRVNPCVLGDYFQKRLILFTEVWILFFRAIRGKRRIGRYL